MKLEDQLLEMIRRLEEEIRINDQRIKQLLSQISGGSGDMYKIVYDTDNDGIVDNAEQAQSIDGGEF